MNLPRRKTLEEELDEITQKEGAASAWRHLVRTFLELNYSTLPDELLQRLAVADIDRLKTAHEWAYQSLLKKRPLEELPL
jgi:hypothetical protein